MRYGKPTCGYDRLKVKYEKLLFDYKSIEKANDNLQDTIAKQASRISELAAALHNAEAETFTQRVSFEREREEMLEHMGWFKRWTWYFDHRQDD